MEAESGRLSVYCGSHRLGYVQAKHAWLKPLIEHGAKVCLTRVTGTERPEWTMGCNVHFARVAPAIEALRLRRRRSSSEKVGGGGKPAGMGSLQDAPAPLSRRLSAYDRLTSHLMLAPPD